MSIPYRYIDFPPIIMQEKLVGVTLDVQYELLQDTVVRANEWIVRAGVRVLNIETIVLPAPLNQPDYNTAANGFRCGESRLVQVVRVWYTKED